MSKKQIEEVPTNGKKEYPINGSEQICINAKKQYKFVKNNPSIKKYIKRQMNKRFRRKNKIIITNNLVFDFFFK